MANLLDQASIVLTPTAYNNGEALCVKPSDGSGDFDFSRNSAATRVNAQGLVENVQILSSNLVQNGDFSEEGSELITNGDFSSDTAWIKGTGTTISEGNANFVNADGVSLYQSIGNQSGFVKITFNVTDYTSGTLNVYSGGNQSVSTINVSANALGTYTAYVDRNGGNVNIIFGSSDNFTGSIDNCSVREVGQDWTLTDGCSIIEQGLRIVSDGTIQDAIQSNVVTSGKNYKVQYEIIEAVSGSLKITGTFGADLAINSTVGVHTFYATATDPNFKIRRNASPTDITITNISVLEITDDTNLPRINYEGFSYQDALGSEEVVNGGFDSDTAWIKSPSGVTISGGAANFTSGQDTYVYQDILVIGKQYKISLEYNVASISSGYFGSNGGTGDAVISISSLTGNGVLSGIITASNGKLIIRTSTLNGSIDNVSVKEYLGQEVVPDSGCGSWLFEPQSTNLYTQSELFTDSSWNKTQTVIEAASIILPNGLTNGFKLFANTTGGTNHWLEKSPFPTATTGQDYTLSLFVKSAGSDFIQIASSSGFPSRFQNFNISTGTKASGDISDSSITDFGNGWYRISVTETTTGTTARYLIVPILSDVGRNAQFAGNADEDGVYIWGAMLEQNSFSTSYIPTEGSTVTRNQDVCTNGGSLATINSTEGTLYVEATIQDTSTFKTMSRLTATDTSTSDGLWIYARSDNKIQGVLRVGGVDQVALTSVSTFSGFVKVAFKYSLNNFSLWINGIEIATDTSGSVFPVNTLSKIGFKLGTNTNPFFGKTKALAVWKEALSDQELTELTTI